MNINERRQAEKMAELVRCNDTQAKTIERLRAESAGYKAEADGLKRDLVRLRIKNSKLKGDLAK